VACGCPAGLLVRHCSFARQPDGVRLSTPRAGALWGSKHEFVVDERTTASVGQMTASVYDWERRQVGFGLDEVMTVPDVQDSAAQLAHSCILTLASTTDGHASHVLTPNLALVDRRTADRIVYGLACALNWSRLRLLYLGHREVAPCTLHPAPVGQETPALADEPISMQGCLFALLDLELITLIAQWLIELDSADEHTG